MSESRYPSYVQDIMGDIFSLGFGPFRWVCTSGDHKDLVTTDKIATQVKNVKTPSITTYFYIETRTYDLYIF